MKPSVAMGVLDQDLFSFVSVHSPVPGDPKIVIGFFTGEAVAGLTSRLFHVEPPGVSCGVAT